MPVVLSALGIIIGLAGVLGIAYAVFTSARVQKTVDLYKLENEAQGKRIKTLEDEDRIKAEQITSLRRENDTLRDLATGRSHMEALAKDVREAEAVRRTEHMAMMQLLAEMKDMLQEMWQGIIRFFGDGRQR